MHRILRMGVVVLCLPLLAWAAEKAPVPQTGQSIIYDTTVPPGDDGALQVGVPLPIPRFVDTGDGTLRDPLTGLIWLKRATCAGSGRTWQQALDDIVALNTTGTVQGHDCGDTSARRGTHQRDWRLPNIKELLSLVDYGFWQPALANAAGTAQAQCQPETDCPFVAFWSIPVYWSSTTLLPEPGSAWYVNFIDGSAGAPRKNQELGVLAVRGGR